MLKTYRGQKYEFTDVRRGRYRDAPHRWDGGLKLPADGELNPLGDFRWEFRKI